MTGGVGNTEQERLRELEDDFNVRIALTAPNGAYLSSVDIAIEDSWGRSLVQTTANGPIVLARLEPGGSTLSAHTEGRETARRTIEVPPRGEPVRLNVALADEDGAEDEPAVGRAGTP